MARPRNMSLADALAQVRTFFDTAKATPTVTQVRQETGTSTAAAGHLIRAVRIERGDLALGELAKLPPDILSLVQVPASPPEQELLAHAEQIKSQVRDSLSRSGQVLEDLFGRIQLAFAAARAAVEEAAATRIAEIAEGAERERNEHAAETSALKGDLLKAAAQRAKQDQALADQKQEAAVLAERAASVLREKTHLSREVERERAAREEKASEATRLDTQLETAERKLEQLAHEFDAVKAERERERAERKDEREREHAERTDERARQQTERKRLEGELRARDAEIAELKVALARGKEQAARPPAAPETGATDKPRRAR